jgi:hypothetical protein
VSDTLQKEMNMNLFSDNLELKKDTFIVDESLDEVWRRFERTGSISAFLTYNQIEKSQDLLSDPIAD